MAIVMNEDVTGTPQGSVDFAWLEITPSCQLKCIHCYKESMPGLGHGRLQIDDWKRVITSLHALGTRFVQFIGGEPTIHPHFCELVKFAGGMGLKVEVYSNLVSITPRMWELFACYNVRVATSFYAAEPALHEAITTVCGSYQKTVTNITKVLALGLRLRIGIVHIRDDQSIADTKAFLLSLGVNKEQIGVDRVRGVGRGSMTIQEDPVSALCGKCVTSRCVITANGEVYPCVFSRSFSVGNVLAQDITDIVHGLKMQATIKTLSAAFASRQEGTRCEPLDCDPECDPQTYPPCDPDCCPETVASCEPTEDSDDDDDE